MSKKKICVVITARPSYSRIMTAMRAIQEHPNLELQLVVAASALLDRYGKTINYIEKDGFEITARVYSVLEGENLTAMAKTAGLGILELSTVFDNLKPDAVLTIADRFETMSTAVAASFMNIPLIHVQGGEVSGNIDEKVRHAITKLADIHLVASGPAQERLIKMGENPKRVFLTGCPSIDIAKKAMAFPELDFDPMAKYGGVGAMLDLSQGYIVVMQHPVTTEYASSREHVKVTLSAIAQLKLPTLWFWPNVDAGSDGTSKGLRAFRESEDASNIHFFKNMEPQDFLRLLINSRCLIGNSSVGIRECAYMGVPVVNIGSRQQGRDRGKNVVDVSIDRDAIIAAVNSHISNGSFEADNLYGDGSAGEQIAQVLSEVDFDIRKMLTY